MIIDAHAHVTGPVEMVEYFRGFINVSGSREIKDFPFSDERLEESIEEHLAEVGGVGTDFQLVAARPGAIPTGERRAGLVMRITQQSNNMLARCAKLHPDRFAGVAGLPQSLGTTPKDWVEELDRCVNELGFVGVKINPDPGEGLIESPHMGEEYWYPLYEKMVELDVPGLIHGGGHRFSREPELGYFPQEETVTALGIIRSPNVFKDFPNLKIVVGHGGGYIPYQVGRARAFRLNGRDDQKNESFDESMRRLYYDTVHYNRESIELLIKVVGADRCLFGSDKPANGSVKDPNTGKALNDVKWYIDNIPWLTEADRRMIFEDNVRKVYTRLRVPVTG